MPSKSTFALVALLAATSVSALPTRGGWVDLVERGPDTPVVSPPAAVAATPVVSGQQQPVAAPAPVNAVITNAAPGRGSATHPHPRPHHHHHQNQNLATTGNAHHHHHHHPHTGAATAKLATNPDGTIVKPHRHHHHSSSSSSSSAVVPNSGATQVTPPVAGAATPAPPVAAAPTLSRREYYESLYERDLTDPVPVPHPHPHHRHHHHGNNGMGSAPQHHHHHHARPRPQAVNQNLASTPNPPVSGTDASAPVQNSRRELLERRGLLETLGLKARTSSLTVKQTEQMSKAKTICGGLSSKKDQHSCHKNIDKIIQLTKERNYDIEQFIKHTNHHDVFTSSDPSLSSSSTSSH